MIRNDKDGRGIGFTLILLLSRTAINASRAFKTVGAYHGLFWYLVWCGVVCVLKTEKKKNQTDNALL